MSDFKETPQLREALNKTVVSSGVENVGRKGIEFTNEPLHRLTENVGYFIDKTKDNKTKTSVLSIPLTHYNPDVVQRAGLLDTNLQNNKALIIEYQGVGVDKFGRSGKCSAVIVASNENSENIIKESKENPGFIFSLIRAANEGPVRMFDGAPMKINPGPNIEFLPNNQFGGNQTQSEFSSPFPEGYSPNPLFN